MVGEASTAAVGAVPMASNFLVPNGTFFVELIAFLVILYILARYIIPPINQAMAARQEAIRKQFADLDEAQADARKAEEQYKAQLEDARHQAAQTREEAREQGAAIIADMRKQAQEESERILRHGRSQLDAERQQAVQQLRGEVGSMATQLAGRIVGESLEDDDRRARTVDRFIASLDDPESPAGAGGAPDRSASAAADDSVATRDGSHSMGADVQSGSAASRDAVIAATEAALAPQQPEGLLRFLKSEGPGADPDTLGTDLFEVATLLDRQHALRRALTEPSVPATIKQRLLRTVLGEKVGEPAQGVLDEAVGRRWSRSLDLADTLEQAAVIAHVARAEADGRLDAVEDDLFRFARIVEGSSGLRELLADPGKSLEGKRALLDRILGDDVDPTTRALLAQVAAARHPSVVGTLESYQEQAAARQQRIVATVWVATALDPDQHDRLAAALGRQYDREVHLNVVVDPSVLGGVRVAIADEVIDSTVQSRLRLAERQLAG